MSEPIQTQHVVSAQSDAALRASRMGEMDQSWPCNPNDVGNKVAYTLMELVAVAQTAVLYKVDEINCSNKKSQDYINLRGSMNALLKEYGKVTGDSKFKDSDYWKRMVSGGDVNEIKKCIDGKPIEEWASAIDQSQYGFSTNSTKGFFIGLASTACGLEKISEENPAITPPFDMDDAKRMMRGDLSYTDASAQDEKLSTIIDSRSSATQMQMVTLQSLQSHLNAYLTGASSYQKDYGDILRDILSKL